MANELRQMTLEEVEDRLRNEVGTAYHVVVKKTANGHVQITTTRKTA